MAKKRFAAVLALMLVVVMTLTACGSGAKTDDRASTAGTVTNTIDMSKYAKGEVVRAWLPIPQDNDDQTITDVKYEAKTAAVCEEKEDELGNKMLYVEWDKDAEPADRVATLTFHATRYEVTAPEFKEEGDIPDDVKEYLEPSSTIPTDGAVKALADEITKNEDTTLGKARAIYEWIYNNMNRDESVVGCGTGNVPVLITTKAGKCTDINSVFVGLCRAAGIPAREMFGIRINDADITKNQHCWAQFYLPGTGWVYADPADVLKFVLKENKAKDSDEAKEKLEFYWGNNDSQRVELSHGRDITLEPKQNGDKLNNFGYPHAEVGSQVIDCYQPDQFVYTYAFEADAE